MKVLKAKKYLGKYWYGGSNNYEVGDIFSVKKITYRNKIFLYEFIIE